jgi:hypothetical protein
MWLTFPGGSIQVSMRMPKGPKSTEIWWFTLIDHDMPAENQASHLSRAIHVFGPAGMLEQEDGENWDQSTRGASGTVSKRFPLNYGMNVGHGVIIEDETGPPHVECTVNEHPQLWMYRSWCDWMAAESWGDLKANHTRTPSGVV